MMLDKTEEQNMKPKASIYPNGFLNSAALEQHYIYRGCKRLFDIVASACALVLLSPLFLIVAIWIKHDEPGGTIFYAQTRLGKQQRPFKMYKFRSMVVDGPLSIK